MWPPFSQSYSDIKIIIKFLFLLFSTPRNFTSFDLSLDLLFVESQIQKGLNNITQLIMISSADLDPLRFSPILCQSHPHAVFQKSLIISQETMREDNRVVVLV